MIKAGDFSNGTVFADGDQVLQVVWFQHHKPGKGGAMVRLKLKNLATGSTVEKTIKPDEKFREVPVERNNLVFMYKDDMGYHFMDNASYEQMALDEGHVGDAGKFLKEDSEVVGVYIDGKLSHVELPINMVFEIVETEPGVKGNSVTNMMKPAKLETGAEVKVPLFVNQGEKVKVNTQTGEYVERA